MAIIETRKALKKGQWLFTCDMKPLQFNSFDPEKNKEDYSIWKNEKAWELFSKYDDFTTLEGSSHSACNCGLTPISEKYAKWFITNKIWELYNDDFEIYEELIKKICKEHNINFEGC